MDREDNRVKIARGLRIVAAACFVAAGVVLLFVARGTDWLDDFKFNLYVNFIAGAYNGFVLALPRDSKLGKITVFIFIFIIDLVLCILISSSLGVGWQLYKVFNEGNSRRIYEDNYNYVVVEAVCGYGIAHNFCRNILVSFILSTIGFVISFVFHAYCIIVSVNALDQ